MLCCRYKILVCEAIQQHLLKHCDPRSCPGCLCFITFVDWCTCGLVKVVGLNLVPQIKGLYLVSVSLCYLPLLLSCVYMQTERINAPTWLWTAGGLQAPQKCSYKHGLLDLVVYVHSGFTDYSVQTLPESVLYHSNYFTDSSQRSKPDNV